MGRRWVGGVAGGIIKNGFLLSTFSISFFKKLWVKKGR